MTAGSGTPVAQSSKGSSLSGGAIAGIVIGVIAGLAILALLAFFVLRRRRSKALANDLEANRLNAKGGKTSDAFTPKSSNMHTHLGSLNTPGGLDWKEGDEIKSNRDNQSRVSFDAEAIAAAALLPRTPHVHSLYCSQHIVPCPSRQKALA